MQTISELLYYIAIVVIGLLPIANPFSTAPVFLAVSSNLDTQSRYKLLKLTCIYMFCILIVFLLIGALILSFFGISVSALRISGGLIITVLGFRMLFPTNTPRKRKDRSEKLRAGKTPGIYPSCYANAERARLNRCYHRYGS